MNYQELLNKMETQAGFFKHNNFKVVEANEKTCKIKLNITDNSLNFYGIVHGGAIFGLGDTVMGMLARATGKKAVTLNANITYLKPSTGKYLVAIAEMIKKGKSTCFLRANIYNDKEELVATMDSNYFYID